MIEYIYFVKCPSCDNCEDEPFYIFNDAVACALGRLSKKPIITQVEVDRNDFGECTDSHDLGTIWSWENMMSDVPDNTPELLTFSKDDIQPAYDADQDPEFLVLDDSFKATAETEALEMTADELMSKHGTTDVDLINAGRPEEERVALKGDMSIDDLVEALEENEDYVECKGCYDLVEKTRCVKGTKGYICKECAELNEASLADIASAASDVFDDHYTEQDLLDFAGITDLDSFENDDTRSSINWEEPFSKYKMMRDAKARKRNRQQQQAQQRSLNEAGKYDFYKLFYTEDAKEQILTELDLDYRTGRFVKGDSIEVPFVEVNTGPSSISTTKTGNLTDFEINKDGRIIVSGMRNGKPGQWDLAKLLRLLARGSSAYEFFITLRDIAIEINKKTKISAVRDAVAKTDLSKKIAHELAYHITSIKYSIPEAPKEVVNEETLLDYAPAADETATEINAMTISKSLNSMYDNFEAWLRKFPDNAAAASKLVAYRPVFVEKNDELVINDSKLIYLGTWAPEATIRLDCKFGSLSDDTQNYIAYIKSLSTQKGEYAPKTKTAMLGDTTIESIRVAKALSDFFKDLLFFEKDIELVPDENPDEEVIEVDFNREPATV
jgi:hypothetical protein